MYTCDAKNYVNLHKKVERMHRFNSGACLPRSRDDPVFIDKCPDLVSLSMVTLLKANLKDNSRIT